jgi:hypothetical protein
LVLISVLFLFQLDLPKKSPKWANVLTVIVSVLSLVLAVLAIRNLPFIDFRAYKVGVNIPKNMLPSSPLEYTYVMQKDGKLLSFDQYPNDESLEFVEMNLNNPDALPKISDFAVWNENGDYSEELFTGNKALIMVSNMGKMSEAHLTEIDQLIDDLSNSPIEPVFVAAASQEVITAFMQSRGWDILGLQADATVVKTIIRANPGLMFLKDGVVLAKFHHNNTPDANAVLDLYIK